MCEGRLSIEHLCKTKACEDNIRWLCQEVHQIASDHGWWNEERNDGELIALMHSELSEALEALRAGNKANLAEELADTVIRICDFAEARGLDLGLAVLEKMDINANRSHKHGGKAF